MKSKPIRIFMTGGTGFLGKEIISLLHMNPNVEVHVLSRSPPALINYHTAWKGNLTLFNAGLNLKELKKIKFDAVLHLASLYDLNASYQDVIVNNVFGTNMALKLTQELEVPLFINTSSIAAVSNCHGIVSPYDLNLKVHFPDAYSEGKALTEAQIQNWSSATFSKINLRLGILVGHSKTGRIQRVDGPYEAIKGFQKLKTFLGKWSGVYFLPGNENVRLPFVPIDKAAQGVLDILFKSLLGLQDQQSLYQSYHLVPRQGVEIRKFYLSVMSHLGISNFDFKLVKDLPTEITASLAHSLLEFPKEQLRYALDLPSFNTEDTEKMLGVNWCPEFSEYEQSFWSGYEKFISDR